LEIKKCEIINGNSIFVLPQLEPSSFDALITDPPYSSGGQYRSDRMQRPSEKYSASGTKQNI
jgi:site-specific DNA-methyltransferase (adenine-specific)